VNPLSAIVLATANPGKAREFGRLLGEAVRVDPLPRSLRMPEETGATFAENARLKAEAAFEGLGRAVAVLADDSGLEVAALDGRPGIMSARFAGEGASDEQNVQKLLGLLSGRADRQARFVCCLCLLLPGEPMIEVEGRSEGAITEAPRGTDGFGYDPVFEPMGWASTLAEADARHKDSVSHRGAAARALLAEVERRGLLDRGL
jgi:XTP/dITP diphosphohydrolase